MPLVHSAFGTGPTFYMPPTALIRRPDDMLSSPLGQHIEPPRRFVIPKFSTFDGFADCYDHMLHYNQSMILNAENDRLLCKLFSAILRGPALTWFHKLPCNSINAFNELWGGFRVVVSFFDETKKEHQLLTYNSQIGRRVYSRLHNEVRASCLANKVV